MNQDYDNELPCFIDSNIWLYVFMQRMVIDSFDVETCSIIESFPLSAATEYTDIEGIALECH